MNDYETLAGNLNKIGGTNVASGVEPATIAARFGQQKAMRGLRMNRLDEQTKRNNLLKLMQEEEMRKEQEPDVLDFLSLVPGVAGVGKGIQARDEAGQQNALMRRLYSYGPGY